MGSSPHAEIFYGVYLGAEGIWHNDDAYGDLPDILRDQEDMENAQIKILDPGLVDPKWGSPQWDANYKRKRQIAGQVPLQVVSGGCFEYNTLDYNLVVKASITSTDWDSNPLSLASEPIMTMDPKALGWDALLEEWANKLGIPWDKIVAANPEGPRWMIVTSTR